MTKLNPAAASLNAPKIAVVTLTPDLARKLLEGRAVNRNISDASARKIAKAIREGTWRTTHQAIAVTHDGKLLDGQHRCKAVVLANKTIPVLMATYPEGANPVDCFDIGTKRTAGHMLEILGLVPTGKGRRYEAMARALGIGLRQTVRSTLDEHDIAAVVQRFRGDLDWAGSLAHRRLVASHYAALAYAHPVCPDKIAEAARRLINNADMKHRSPLWLLSDHIDKSIIEGRTSNDVALDTFVRTLRALEAFVKDEAMRQLKGKIEGDLQPKTITYWQNERAALGLPVELLG